MIIWQHAYFSIRDGISYAKRAKASFINYVQQQTKQLNVTNGLRKCRVTQCFPLIQSASLSGCLILVSSLRTASLILTLIELVNNVQLSGDITEVLERKMPFP